MSVGLGFSRVESLKLAVPVGDPPMMLPLMVEVDAEASDVAVGRLVRRVLVVSLDGLVGVGLAPLGPSV